MARGFDHFMVHVDIGTEEKFATLTDSEFRCHVAGVLPIAAKSPIRGRLIVGEVPALPVHIARRAGVSERVVKSTFEKLAEVGVLLEDEELGCWRVHNFEVHNPAPKVDRTNADRQRRYREKRNGVTNGDVTPPEVEEEVKPPLPPLGGNGSEVLPPGPRPHGNRQTTLRAWERNATEFALSVLPHLEPRQAFGELGVIWMRMGQNGYTASADEIRAFIAEYKPHLLEGATAA